MDTEDSKAKPTSVIPILPTSLENIKIPLRFLPANSEHFYEGYETRILSWLHHLQDDEDVVNSKDLSYIVKAGRLPDGNIELSLRLMESFVEQVLLQFENPSERYEEDQPPLNKLKTILHVYRQELKHYAISFLVYFNSSSLGSYDFDPWFDDYYLVICPRLFGNYILYPFIKCSGVKLKHVYQVASVNISLDQLNMDWKSFNKN